MLRLVYRLICVFSFCALSLPSIANAQVQEGLQIEAYSVGFLVSDNGDPEDRDICTGVLVAPEIFLTAISCVTDQSGKLYGRNWRRTVLFGDVVDENKISGSLGSATFTSDDVELSPMASHRDLYGSIPDHIYRSGLAVIHLHNIPVGLKPMPIVDSGKETISDFRYYWSHQPIASDHKGARKLHLGYAGGHLVDQRVVIFEGHSNYALLDGDSGAPVIRLAQKDSQDVLISICTEHGLTDPGKLSFSSFTLVAPYISFIRDSAAKWGLPFE